MKCNVIAIFMLFMTLSVQSQRYVDGSGVCGSNSPCYNTIQAAVNAASPGETIYVYPGTYNEKIVIEKPLVLQSTGGKSVTTLQYTILAGYVAPIIIQADAGSYSGVTIGGSAGTGFTIIGSDVTNDVQGGNSESAAIMIGSNSANSISNINISYNTITANGDLALLTYYKGSSLYNDVVIQHNLFDGKTYVGTPQSGGNTAHGNVPRQLIAVNPGMGNLTFTNNRITGTSGEMVGGNAIGNMVVTLDAATSLIRENYFEPSYVGTLFSPRYALRVGGSGSTIACNFFSMANASNAGYVTARTASSYVVASVAGNNTFVNPGGVRSGNNINRYTGSGTPVNSAYPAPACGTLPVNFGPVTATIVGDNLQVKWTTLTETNNAYFEVEASKDGHEFTSMGRVDSSAVDGNSSISIHYSFSKVINRTAMLSMALFGLTFGLLFPRRRLHWLYLVCGISLIAVSGIRCSNKQDSIDKYGDKLYVRILQVDKDGSKTYSKVVAAIGE